MKRVSLMVVRLALLHIGELGHDPLNCCRPDEHPGILIIAVYIFGEGLNQLRNVGDRLLRMRWGVISRRPPLDHVEPLQRSTSSTRDVL